MGLVSGVLLSNFLNFLQLSPSEAVSQIPPSLCKDYSYNKPSVCCAPLLQSGSTLCDPTDCSPPGSSVHGILQVRILERVAMPSSSRGSSWPRDWTHISYVAGGFFTCWATRGSLIINPLICNIYRFYFPDQILAGTDGNTTFPISM